MFVTLSLCNHWTDLVEKCTDTLRIEETHKLLFDFRATVSE